MTSHSRPEEPKGKVIYLEEKYSGRSTKDKLVDLRAKLTEVGAKALVLSALGICLMIIGSVSMLILILR